MVGPVYVTEYVAVICGITKGHSPYSKGGDQERFFSLIPNQTCPLFSQCAGHPGVF